MHRKIALLGVLLILLSFYPAVAALANGNSGASASTGWQSAYGGRVYNAELNTTTFTWYVYDLDGDSDTTPAAHALSHFIVGVCGAAATDGSSGLNLMSSTPEQAEWTYIHGQQNPPLISGYKWDYPVDPGVDRLNPATFTLIFSGNVPEGGISVEFKAGQGDETAPSTGPANSNCGGDGGDGGGGDDPTPSGTVEINKTAQNVCVGGTVNWEISAEYTLSNATTADLVFTDTHLWGSDTVTATVSAPSGTYTIPSGTSEPGETAGPKQNSASVALMHGSTPLDSDELEESAEVQVYSDQFTLTVTLHRTDTGSNVTNGTVPSGKAVKPRYTVTNTGDVALQNIQVFLGTELVHTFASLGVNATDSWDGPAVTINAENPSASWDAYATADVDPTGLGLAESDTNCGASSDPEVKTVTRRTSGGGGGSGGTPTYAVDISLAVSADCGSGFTWTATVTNNSSVTTAIDVDFDRPGMEDVQVTVAAGASTTITRSEPVAASRSLSVTAAITGTGASASDTAAASLNCDGSPPTQGEIPPDTPATPPAACVPVIDVMVLDEQGAGIAGALVRLGGATTTTTAEGVATFTSVGAGTHTVTASAFGYNSGSGSITLAEGACEASTEVVLKTPVLTILTPPAEPGAEPLGNITGNICLMEGLGNVDVTLAKGVTKSAQVPSGGSYSFEGLAAGTYTVSASSNLGADSQQVSIGNGSPLAAVVDFCFQAPPSQAPLPRTGGPVWPSYLGGSALLALGLVFRRRVR